MAGLVCVGDNVVDVYKSLGLLFPGGNAVNVAVAAQRAGVKAAYVGAIGNDRAGRVVLDALVSEDVEVSRVRVVEGPNAYATIELVDGNRVFGCADIGVSRLSLDEDDPAYLAGFDLIHTGNNSRLENQIGEIAKAAPVSYDFGEEPAEYWKPLAQFVRIACFSAGHLSPAGAEELARSAASLGPELVLVTEGDRGAILFDHGVMHRVGTSVKPVDTLGAGDSFMGRFLAGVIVGEEPRNALSAANRAAAATCLHHGAFGHEAPLLSGDS